MKFLFACAAGIFFSSASVLAAPASEKVLVARQVDMTNVSTSNVTNSEFDCPSTTRMNLTNAELQNAMDDFANSFYIERNLTAAFDGYVASNYVQHNPNILDGREAAVEALTPLFAPNNTAVTFILHRVMVGPEYTTIQIQANNTGGPSFVVYDIYRTLANSSCIVEHWDVMQQISNMTTNPHPYF